MPRQGASWVRSIWLDLPSSLFPMARARFTTISRTRTNSSRSIVSRCRSNRAGRLRRLEGQQLSLSTASIGGSSLSAVRATCSFFFCGGDPQMLIVMDADSGKVIQSFPISAGVDAAVYDEETGLIFASTREGMIHIFHEDSPDQFSVVETVKTQVGAKTMGLDTKTHNLFLDTAHFAPH